MVVLIDGEHKCPVDGQRYVFRLDRAIIKYCGICGQALNAAMTTDSFGKPIGPEKSVIPPQPKVPIKNVGK